MVFKMNSSMELQQFFPVELKIQDIRMDDDTVYITLKSMTKKTFCPKCGKEISKYHAVHKRTVQDLPILGKKTILQLSLYEYECDNDSCTCVSVTENFDGFLNNYCRMTERLVDLVIGLALETSCEGAARILTSMNVKISGDTVIRTLIKRFRKQDNLKCGNCIGVDDFAFKKRHKYGTVIVDENTHQTIAILDGREEKTLRKWLEKNKHVTTITRDRASAYAKAIEEVLPDAMQIADRFHLHQNLLEVVNKILGREIPATTAIPRKKEDNTCDTGNSQKEGVLSNNSKKNVCCCG